MKQLPEVLDELWARERAGRAPQMIYLMTSREFGGCKIGVSWNPRRRLREVARQRGLRDIRLRAMFDPPVGSQALEVEIFAHALLHKRGIDGEWFTVKPRTALRAILLAAGAIQFAYAGGQVGRRARLILCAQQKHRFAGLQALVDRPCS